MVGGQLPAEFQCLALDNLLYKCVTGMRHVQSKRNMRFINYVLKK